VNAASVADRHEATVGLRAARLEQALEARTDQVIRRQRPTVDGTKWQSIAVS
jgi:hypothetical protein